MIRQRSSQPIVQSSNYPIVLQFAESVNLLAFKEIIIDLKSRSGIVKSWKKDEVIINEQYIIIPLTQKETAEFPVGKLTISMKALNDDGYICFFDETQITIKSYSNKKILGDDVAQWIESEEIEPIPIEEAAPMRVKVGRSPYISAITQTWWTYNDNEQKYEDTHIKVAAMPYKKIRFIDDYKFEAWYEDLDYDFAIEYYKNQQEDPDIGACSSVRNGDWYGRNYDWNYDLYPEMVIHTPRQYGRYASVSVVNLLKPLTNEEVKSGTYHEEYKILPFKIADGINEYGVVMNVNVVPNDKTITRKSVPEVEEKLEISTRMLVRYVLDNFKSAREAVNYIRDYLSLYTPQALIDLNFESHFMIADETDTFLLEFLEDENGIVRNVITEMTPGANNRLSGKPYMTNYILTDVIFNDDGTVYTPDTIDEEHSPGSTNNITDFGAGLERYNLIVNNYDNCGSHEGMRALLNQLKYTNTYQLDTDPYWCSEFVHTELPSGEILTVNTPGNIFHELAPIAYQIYLNRSREDGSTWQTTHSSIYDIKNRKLYLICQEDDEELTFELEVNNSNGYQKPNTGIPYSDLSSEVVNKLLPVVTQADNGKILTVINGQWTLTDALSPVGEEY